MPQAWEYMVFRVSIQAGSKGENYFVVSVNGQMTSNLLNMIRGKQPPLPDFLNEIGEKGWEVVSCLNDTTLIAKRLKQQE